MTVRSLSIVFVSFGLLLATTGCGSESSLRTVQGHSLDDRPWAVGTTVDLYGEQEGMFSNPDVRFEAPSGGDSDVVTSDWGGYGEVVQPGTFDAVLEARGGKELERVTLRAEEAAGYKLGVLLDDCPEFADVIFDSDPALLEGSEVMLAPTPVNAAGEQLLGHFPFTASSASFDVYDEEYAMDYASVSLPEAVSGVLSFEINGTTHDFPMDVVSREEIVAMEIAAIPEKHGAVNESLLCAIGRTADGRMVHGIQAMWSDGMESATVIKDNHGKARACFDGMCAEWAGSSAL